jgi:hypothetical protein
MTPVKKRIKRVARGLMLILSMSITTQAGTRTLEMRFAISSDSGSQFSTQFPLPGPGRIVIEADWKSSLNRAPVSLTLLLIKPDGATATRKTGGSILQLAYVSTDQEAEASGLGNQPGRWTVEILNDSSPNRSDVSGTLRITVPASTRVLEDTQFTLLGSGNAQEIPFTVTAPGRLDVDVTWEPDALSTAPSSLPAMTVSLIHPGEARTYVRKQGSSPIKFDQQVTEQALDRGLRWIVRVQSDSTSKIRGRVKVAYSPSL